MLTGFFAGRCRVSVPAEQTAPLLNLLLRTGFPYRDFSPGEAGGSTSLVLSARAARKLTSLLTAGGIAAECVPLGGLPLILRALADRPGLLAGLLAACALTLFSCATVWEVSVTGNVRLTDGEVRDLLAAEGLAVGTGKRGLNTDRIEASVMQKSPEISWMSVNLYGSSAFVQVREEEEPPAESPPYPDAAGINLIAARDGVVIGYALSAGKPAVPTGNAVRAGELLVSGILTTPQRGTLILRAEGEVLARTEHTLRVTVPLETEVIVPTGRKTVGISLIFFGFRQKIFKNYGNLPPDCDTIIMNNYIYEKEDRIIPVGWTTERVLLTSRTPKTRTEREALALAYLELERAAAAETAGRTLLARTVTESVGEGAVTLVCRLECIENIAVAAPIRFTGNGGGAGP